MAVARTYEERMALIASLAPKYNRRAKTYRTVQKVKVKREAMQVPKEKENVYHYTDASKYAEEHYGETFRATTGLDNDWGDH